MDSVQSLFCFCFLIYVCGDRCLKGSERAIKSPGAGVTVGCDMGVRELNASALEKQGVLLMAEPSL